MKITYYLIAILIWLLTPAHSLMAQVPYDKSYQGEASDMRENITLFTDRNMYAVNERINFRSFYRINGEAVKEAWSKVLYVELVSPAGKAVSSGKYYHDEKGSSGYLTIPEDALTGNYYLRCYTRWMRNFGPRSYCYIPLTIINPYKQDVFNDRAEQSPVDADRFKMSHSLIRCQTNKLSYAPGEEVKLELSRFDSEYSLPEEYCLTVVPGGLADTLNAHMDIDDKEMDNDFNFDFLPDIRGVSISGSVVNTEDQSPAPLSRVHFSILGEKPGYFATISDDLGRFTLTVPDRTGIQELFVACEPIAGAEREILIDHDFAQEPIPFGTEQFGLSEDDRGPATRMVLNMQLSMAYDLEEDNSGAGTETGSWIPFYGEPVTTINIQDFVKLPTMTEVFINLVPTVFVKYQRGVAFLNIESSYSSISLFPPLVLVDQIPVFDQKAVFSIDPSKIERIEVINELYVKGGIMYGGIIILTSIKGDMAAVDLPEESYFFDYRIFHPQTSNSGSQTTQKNTGIKTDRIPDTRNTLLWIDQLSIGLNEKKTVQFPAASGTGEYHILIRGVSSGADIVYGVSTFNVD